MSADIAEEMARLNRTAGDPAIDRPSHYVAPNGMEALDFIESFSLGFHEGNILEYIVRWRKKDGVKDLYRARNLLERLIVIAESER